MNKIAKYNFSMQKNSESKGRRVTRLTGALFRVCRVGFSNLSTLVELALDPVSSLFCGLLVDPVVSFSRCVPISPLNSVFIYRYFAVVPVSNFDPTRQATVILSRGGWYLLKLFSLAAP